MPGNHEKKRRKLCSHNYRAISISPATDTKVEKGEKREEIHPVNQILISMPDHAEALNCLSRPFVRSSQVIYGVASSG